jgi:hypothetical protein
MHQPPAAAAQQSARQSTAALHVHVRRPHTTVYVRSGGCGTAASGRIMSLLLRRHSPSHQSGGVATSSISLEP